MIRHEWSRDGERRVRFGTKWNAPAVEMPSTQIADLIAAAPEMYEALRGISDALMGRPDIVKAIAPLLGPAETRAFDKAHDALAKAEDRP